MSPYFLKKLIFARIFYAFNSQNVLFFKHWRAPRLAKTHSLSARNLPVRQFKRNVASLQRGGKGGEGEGIKGWTDRSG